MIMVLVLTIYKLIFKVIKKNEFNDCDLKRFKYINKLNDIIIKLGGIYEKRNNRIF